MQAYAELLFFQQSCMKLAVLQFCCPNHVRFDIYKTKYMHTTIHAF